MEFIKVWLDDQIGISGQYLWLRKSDGTLLNTGGDALTESPASSGQFSATLAESRSGLGTLRATITGSSAADDAVAAGWLAESATLIVDDYPQSASGGAGDASQATLEEVQNAVDSIAVALAGGSPVEPTGTTVFEHLAAIQAATDSIGTRPIEYLGNVADGGQLLLTVGDDHETVIGNDLPIRQKDPGQTLFNKLTAAGVTLQWSAGQGTTPNLITGTVTTPTHAAGITTIIVQVPNTPSPPAPANIFAPFHWQLQRTIGGRRQRMLKGSLKLDPDMIGS